jgi:hypothetical protein
MRAEIFLMAGKTTGEIAIRYGKPGWIDDITELYTDWFYGT